MDIKLSRRRNKRSKTKRKPSHTGYFNSNCKTFRNDFETPWAKEIANRPVKYPIVFRKSEKAREREGAKEGVKERRGKNSSAIFDPDPDYRFGIRCVASQRGRTGRDKGKGARVRHVRFLRSFSFQRSANVPRSPLSLSLSFFVRDAT